MIGPRPFERHFAVRTTFVCIVLIVVSMVILAPLRAIAHAKSPIAGHENLRHSSDALGLRSTNYSTANRENAPVAFPVFKAARSSPVASPNTPGIFAEADHVVLPRCECNLGAAVIDSANGFAYFGTADDGQPGIIIKVRLSDFTRVSALTLNGDETRLLSGVIDTTNGFAYFGTHTSPGKVVKVRLSDFTRVGALTLNAGDDNLRVAVNDTINGSAYFGTEPGKIIKIRLSDFTRAGSLTLSDGPILSAVIDFANDFAYLGTLSNVIKVRLSDMTQVMAVPTPHCCLLAAVIDTGNGFAYFGTNTRPGEIYKIRLSDLSLISTLTLGADEEALSTAVIDAPNSFAYFGTLTQSGLIVKIRLSDFTRVGRLLLYPTVWLQASASDAPNGFIYFGGTNSVAKVQLSDFSHVADLILPRNVQNLTSAVIDPAAGFVYFGSQNSWTSIARIQLANFTYAGTVISTTAVDYQYSDLAAAVIDPGNGFAYFGTNTDPGTVLKVRLSEFSIVGTLVLPAGELGLVSAVIDPANDFAYFGTASAKVVKVRLSTLSRVGAITIDTSHGSWSAAAIDTTHGFAYFGAEKVVKIRLSDFTPVAVLPVGAYRALLDSPAGFAYFATFGWNETVTVTKVRLADFSVVAALTLNPDEAPATSAVIDGAGTYAYFGTFTNPGKIVKVRLSDMARVGAISLNPGECCLTAAAIDWSNGYAYFGSFSNPAVVVKIDLADLDFVKTTNRVTISAGDTFSYSLRATNPTGFTATGLTLTDTMPVSTSVVAVSPGNPTCTQTWSQVVCALGNLPAGASAEVTIQAQDNSTGRRALVNGAVLTVNEPRFGTPITTSVTSFVDALQHFLPLIAR